MGKWIPDIANELDLGDWREWVREHDDYCRDAYELDCGFPVYQCEKCCQAFISLGEEALPDG